VDEVDEDEGALLPVGRLVLVVVGVGWYVDTCLKISAEDPYPNVDA
jgi:hypothetical protein